MITPQVLSFYIMRRFYVPLKVGEKRGSAKPQLLPEGKEDSSTGFVPSRREVLLECISSLRLGRKVLVEEANTLEKSISATESRVFEVLQIKEELEKKLGIEEEK